MNALFHGVDFRKIHAATPFAINSFLYVLGVLAVWAYLIGAIYAVVNNLIMVRDRKN
jgi:hypothetical protein